MKKMIVFKGVSGSEKMDLVGRLCDYYISTENYDDPTQSASTGEVIEWCLQETADVLEEGIVDIVGVDNVYTNNDKEMQKYVDLGKKYGYDVHILVYEYN